MCLRWYSLRKALWRQQRWLSYRITDSSLECPSLSLYLTPPLWRHGGLTFCIVTASEDGCQPPSAFQVPRPGKSFHIRACTHLPVTFTYFPFSKQLGMNVVSDHMTLQIFEIMICWGVFLWGSLWCAWNELCGMLAHVQTGAGFLGCVIECHSEMFQLHVAG